MRLAKALLALSMLVIVAMSITYGAPLSTQPMKAMPLQVIKPIYSPQINVMNKVGPMSFKPDEPLFLTVEVVQLGQGICGLNESNFKLDSSLIEIKRVYPLNGPTEKYPNATCFYDIDVLPAVYKGKQYTWAPSNAILSFKLSYMMNGKELTNKTITLNATTVRELVMSAPNPTQATQKIVVVKR